MKIAVVGTGYVGLVVGACFAETGNDVVCIDKYPSKIERLNNGVMPIYEPGLDKLVLDNMKAGRLSFSTNLADSVSGADAVFIAVGTPSGEDGSADLRYVLEAAHIGIVPFQAFGVPEDSGWFRLSVGAASEAEIAAAIAALDPATDPTVLTA